MILSIILPIIGKIYYSLPSNDINLINSDIKYLISILSYLSDNIYIFDINLKTKNLLENNLNIFNRSSNILYISSKNKLLYQITNINNNDNYVNNILITNNYFIHILPIIFSLQSVKLQNIFHISCSYSFNDSFINLSNLISIKDLGIITIYSSGSFQEVYDFSILSNSLSINNKQNIIHCFYLPTNKQILKEYSKDKISNLINIQKIKEEKEEKHLNNSLYIQSSYDINRLNEYIEPINILFNNYYNETKRKYNFFEYYGSNNAQLIFIMIIYNQEHLLKTLNDLKKENINIGVIIIRIYRPWNNNEFLKLIHSNIKHICVLEQMNKDELYISYPPIYQDIISSFINTKYQNIKISYHYLQSSLLELKSIKHIYNQYILNKIETNTIITNIQKEEYKIEDNSINYNIDKESSLIIINTIKQYYNILKQTFNNDSIEIITSNILKNTNINTIMVSSAEYGLGLYLKYEIKRKQFIEQIKQIIDNNIVSENLIILLKSWYNNYLNINESQKLSYNIQNILNLQYNDNNINSNNKDITYIKDNFHLFITKTFWIIGSEEWCYDIITSGIHNIIRSNKNINLLLINTTLIDNQTNIRRKDIGLYALNYGNSFVSNIAANGSYSQMIRALTEANDYIGPSIILAYSPIDIKQSNIALYSLKETKKAIDTGLWPLYRYNPQKHNSFELDSNKIKSEIENFLKQNNQLTIILQSKVNYNNILSKSNKIHKIEDKKQHLLLSYDKLLQDIQKPTRSILITYGSDGNNAEIIAKRLSNDAKLFKYNSKIIALNDIIWDDVIKEETIILFIISTAGQGEFPSNSKEGWKNLNNNTNNTLLDSIKYSVFALGDSHYWPNEDIFFCKPGKDLDFKLNELGGIPIVTLGLGDDQDDDGWESAFSLWRINLWKNLDENIELLQCNSNKVKPDDTIKNESNFLRGTIAEGLLDTSTLALSYENTKLTKFHGIYQQDDRDLREQRRKEGLEKAFSFMVRIRAPAGVCTPKQWKMFDKLAGKYGNETFKLTTRQAIQLHGILKYNLKQSIQDINRELMDTLAACGDVNRNVMCTPNPLISDIFKQVHEIANKLSEYLTPRTSAYHEIWLDKKKVSGSEIKDIEPIYGPNYLPRKFKIAIAVPPCNDVDVGAHCLGFIAIISNDKLQGFNISIGGGMGMTHNNTKTYPRLGNIIGFCNIDQVISVSEAILLIQRDYGDRVNRKHARLKYTLEDYGVEWFCNQIEQRTLWKLQKPREYNFTSNSDRYGWIKGTSDLWHYTLFIENGRIKDIPGYPLRKALLELSDIHTGNYRLTPNQNLIISNITNDQKPKIEQLFKKYNIDNTQYSALRLNSIACVALPTCGLALAESERYLPILIDKLENILDSIGLRHDAITIRMSGCPNGCSRPYVAEIALVGRAPGIYNLYLGGGFAAERLCKLYKESVNEDEIIELLTPLFKNYALNRLENERFGDFVIRKQIVKETISGRTFHDK